MSVSGGFFEPEPPAPKRPASKDDSELPYTQIWTELLRLGVSWLEAMRMPWSTCRMLFIARAEAYESQHSQREDVRYATKEDISAWI